MPKSHPQPGPVGRRVAEQVRELRTSAHITKTGLSARRKDAGRPLSIDVITKIEDGRRPVDVDGLVALAAALDTDPITLLYGSGGTDRTRRLHALLSELVDEIAGGDRGEH